MTESGRGGEIEGRRFGAFQVLLEEGYDKNESYYESACHAIQQAEAEDGLHDCRQQQQSRLIERGLGTLMRVMRQRPRGERVIHPC